MGGECSEGGTLLAFLMVEGTHGRDDGAISTSVPGCRSMDDEVRMLPARCARVLHRGISHLCLQFWAKRNTTRPVRAFHDHRPSTCARVVTVWGSHKVMSIAR